LDLIFVFLLTNLVFNLNRFRVLVVHKFETAREQSLASWISKAAATYHVG